MINKILILMLFFFFLLFDKFTSSNPAGDVPAKSAGNIFKAISSLVQNSTNLTSNEDTNGKPSTGLAIGDIVVEVLTCILRIIEKISPEFGGLIGKILGTGGQDK